MSALANVSEQTASAAASDHPAIRAADVAAARIAPLWPLQHFVAVNPMLGLSDHGLVEAGRMVAEAGGARLTATRDFYRAALEQGRISDDDIARAIVDLRGQVPGGLHATQIRALARNDEVAPPGCQRVTLALVADEITGTDFSRYLIDRITHWAGDYYDRGAAAWRSTAGSESAWASWRQIAAIDRGPEILGLNGFRAAVAALPADEDELLASSADMLGLDGAAATAYFHRLLSDVSGWAGQARYLRWHEELRGATRSGARDLLLIRLAWERLLLECVRHDGLAPAWAARRKTYLDDDCDQWQSHRAVDHVLHVAFEHATRRELLPQRFDRAPTSRTRPSVQAAFCIDVRSERFRRALESADADIETIGFAGFFGVALAHRTAADAKPGARCPVLLEPPFESVQDVVGHTAARNALRQAMERSWGRFRSAAVSCFGYVEAAGPAYAAKLLAASLGRGQRRVSATDEVRAGHGEALSLSMTSEQKLDVAENLLRGMSLTGNFAPLVLLVGHGSSSTNNPYAAGLDCGACGGHAGDVNARAAARILSDADVRAGLCARGIDVPSDTRFVAALHDTATDEVTLLDTGANKDDAALTNVARRLDAAGAKVRAERAPTLGLKGGALRPFDRRSRDWSQVRPEWGLAGCAAFIAAPRARTRALDLKGRSFLHSYDWRADDNFGVLETILTAPLVVASWISLQYFASTVDNRAFGSGNKTLHNVVGGHGVLEGNGGDVRSGLPWQSVHDGKRLVHEPVRLSAYIEAPTAAIDNVLERHAGLAALVGNGWIQLHAIDDDGDVLRFHGIGRWQKS